MTLDFDAPSWIRFFICCLLLLGYSVAGIAQDAVSVRSGNWHSSSTWENGILPSERIGATIRNGHVVTVTFDSIKPKGLRIEVGGVLAFQEAGIKIKSTGGGISNHGTIQIPRGAEFWTGIDNYGRLNWRGGDLTNGNQHGSIENRGTLTAPQGGFHKCDVSIGATEDSELSVTGTNTEIHFSRHITLAEESHMRVGKEATVRIQDLTMREGASLRVAGVLKFAGLHLSLVEGAHLSGDGRIVIEYNPRSSAIAGRRPAPAVLLDIQEIVVEDMTNLSLGNLILSERTDLYVGDSVSISGSTTVENRGTIHLEGTTLMKRFGLLNEGNLLMTGPGLVRANDSPFDNAWRVTNRGWFSVSHPDTVEISAHITNEGGGILAVEDQSVLRLWQEQQSGLRITNRVDGQLQIGAGSTVLLDQSVTLENNGTVRVDGVLSSISGTILQQPPGVTTGGGNIEVGDRLEGSGTFEPATTILEGGTLDFRNPESETNCMVFKNDLTLRGRLDINGTGPERCAALDHLEVEGTLTLGGELATRNYRYNPDDGAILPIITAATLRGEFENREYWSADRFRYLNLVYNYPNPGQVSLVNGEPLTLTCPENISLPNSPGTCGRAIPFPAVTVTDEEATVSFDYAEDDIFPIGTTTVTATATLGRLEASCSFDVTVTDEEPPALGCPGALTVSLDPCGTYFLDPEGLGITATDNCGPVDLKIDQQNFTGPGTRTVSITATDAAGNESNCTLDLTLEANDDPYTIEAKPDQLGEVCSEEAIRIGPGDILNNDELIVEGELEILDMSVSDRDGRITDNGDGTFTFTSAPGFSEEVELSYRVGVVDGSTECGGIQSGQSIAYLYVQDVVADFTYEPISPEAGELTYSFDDTSEPEASSWTYTVDGNRVSTGNPYRQYRFAGPGIYTVCLSVTTECGQEQVCKDITIGQPVSDDCQEVDFGSGWNYVSFRVQPDGDAARASGVASRVIDAGEIFLLQRRTAEGRIETYLPDYPAYGTDFSVAPGEAYRMYAFRSGTLGVCGATVPPDTRMAIRPGYNWVGYPGKELMAAADYFGDMAGLYFAAEQRGSLNDYAMRYYVPSFPYFTSLTEVASGVGYLVYSFDAVDAGNWRTAGEGETSENNVRLSGTHTTYAGDVSGVDAGEIITITDRQGRAYGKWTVGPGGRLRATTVFGMDTVSGVFADLPPGRELYFRYGGERAAESVVFTGTGGLEWVDLHFSGRSPAKVAVPELTVNPNPFGDELHMRLYLPDATGEVRITLFDLQGHRLSERVLPAGAGVGEHTLEFETVSLPPGTYVLRGVIGKKTVITRHVQKF
jgi:PKD repeat protein